mgnify:FL=1
MLETLFISLRLQTAYSINGIQYYIRKIPFIRKFFWGKPYDISDVKLLFTILGTSWEFIKKIASKFIYIIFLIMACEGILKLSGLPKSEFTPVFIQTFLFSTLIGGIINNPLFLTGDADYYAICLLRMDARKYVFSQYTFYLVHSALTYLLVFFTVGHFFCKISFIDGIIFTIFFVAVKLTATGITLSIDSFKIKDVNWTNLISTTVLLVTAIILPIVDIIIPIAAIRIFMLLFLVTALFGVYRLNTYDNYSVSYRKYILENRMVLSEVESSDALLLQSKRDALNNDMNATSKKQGFAYMHELFIKRHVKVLWKPSLIITVIGLIFIVVEIVSYIFVPEIYADFNVIAILPGTAFLMYLINRGLPFTQALYVNCDHSMLTYSFYKTPSSILKLFVLRLISIIKINLLPAVVIGAALDTLHYVSSNSSNPVDYAVIFISVVSLSIFFSVHYLVIYYLLQPYNAATDVKSPAYSTVKGLTYVVCYLLSQLEVPSLIFGIGTIVFCIVYCIVACVLVYLFAPKTFRIKS